MKNGKDVKIAVLQEQFKNIKDNDLVHLNEKIDTSIADNKEAHKNFEIKIDAVSEKLAILSGKNAVIAAIFFIIVEILFKYVLK